MVQAEVSTSSIVSLNVSECDCLATYSIAFLRVSLDVFENKFAVYLSYKLQKDSFVEEIFVADDTLPYCAEDWHCLCAAFGLNCSSLSLFIAECQWFES